ncbi:MAG: DUF2927 domain-containing protein [Paracoccaceae bacterium]
MILARLTRPVIAALLALSACAPMAPNNGVTRQTATFDTLPAMRIPASAPAPATRRSNASIATEFMALVFQLESGRKLPVLSRFEGPVTLRVTGAPVAAVSMRDLDRLIARLRSEAHVPISRVEPDQRANITVHFLKRAKLRNAVPHAACFVAPGVDNWRDFTRRPNAPGRDWTQLTVRETMAVFLPADVSPQEIRDCLHEEIAQALGPVNDLYHLTDSIFNDDNFHTVLTGFDMVILRAMYHPDLRSGMTPGAVARRLPGILNRINPNGRGGSGEFISNTPRRWIAEIEAALGARGTGSAQLTAARRAVAIATENGWNDNRLGFSLYAQGRLALAQNSGLALNSFEQADTIFRSNPETRLHAAHVSVQSAAFALSSGRPLAAIKIVDDNSAVALRAENPNLLATLLMIKAAALDASGRSAQGDIVRLDSLGWARYGLASTGEIRKRLSEITALAPRITAKANQ